MRLARGLPDGQWDGQLRSAGGHFLQSRAWGELQRASGREVFWGRGEGWSWLGSVRTALGVRYLYCELGPTVADRAGLHAALESLHDAARAAGAAYVRLEPVGDVTSEELTRLGLVHRPYGRHQVTSIVDLTLPAADLLARMQPSHRRTVKGADRRGLVFREGDTSADLDAFLGMLHETTRRTGFTSSSDDYFRLMVRTLGAPGAASLYLMEADGQSVAGCLVFKFTDTWYYGYAASRDALNRKLRAGAPLVWNVMVAAQAAGCRSFDLWGVAPAHQQNDAWAGFSWFKRAFGGRDLERTGTWEMPVDRPRYRLYSALWQVKQRARLLLQRSRSLTPGTIPGPKTSEQAGGGAVHAPRPVTADSQTS